MLESLKLNLPLAKQVRRHAASDYEIWRPQFCLGSYYRNMTNTSVSASASYLEPVNIFKVNF